MTYQHTQIGYAILGSMLAGALIMAAIILPIQDELAGTSGLSIVGLVCLVLLVSAVLFATLSIEVGEDAVVAKFGPGLIRKKISLADIASCEAVKNSWAYGWGIRKIPGGWLYNVSGTKAVEIRHQNGKKTRLGTDEPDQLLEALQRALESRG